jgi:hypothetical protein
MARARSPRLELTMNDDRPASVTTAGLLLVVAALGYLAAIVLAVPAQEIYLSALGGTEPTSLGVVLAVVAPLVVLAAILAREILAMHSGRSVIAGFVAWFVVAALSAVLIAPQVAIGIAVTGAVPLSLTWYGTRRTSLAS